MKNTQVPAVDQTEQDEDRLSQASKNLSPCKQIISNDFSKESPYPREDHEGVLCASILHCWYQGEKSTQHITSSEVVTEWEVILSWGPPPPYRTLMFLLFMFEFYSSQ